MIWDSFAAVVSLFILIGPFVLIGYLIAKKGKGKKKGRKIVNQMQDRLDIALAEQRLQNMKREQALEDQLHEQRKRRLVSDDPEYTEYVDMDEDVNSPIEVTILEPKHKEIPHKPQQPAKSRISRRIAKPKS